MKYLFVIVIVFSFFACSASYDTEKVQNVSASEFKSIADKNGKNILIIDIRTPGEYVAGHIEGAVNVDFYANDFLDEFHKTTANTERFMLYCASGNRSGQTLARFANQFSGNIIHLQRGINEWRINSLPLKTN